MTDEVIIDMAAIAGPEPTPNPIQCILCNEMHPVLPDTGPPYAYYNCPNTNMTIALVNGQNPPT